MVLLGDIVGEDEDAVAAATSHVVRLANARSGEGFIAVSPEARRKFWLDRAKTAAIAKHTNAFKINEDVVIPLERLGEYTDAIERINIELSIRNKLDLLAALEDYLAVSPSPRRHARMANRPAEPRRSTCWRACACTGSTCCENMDARATANVRHRSSIVLQDRSIRVSWKTEVRATAGAHLRRQRIRAGAGRVRCHAQAHSAGPGVRGVAHACRRRQRAHQHSGQFR